MKTFLERFTRSPRKAVQRPTRQETIVSAFARVTSRGASEQLPSTPSLTTATSITDTSSEINDSSTKADGTATASTRLSESSYTAPAHNDSEPVLTRMGKEKDLGSSEGSPVPSADKNNDSQKTLLQESVKALDFDWEFGPLSGDSKQKLETPEPATDEQERQATRHAVTEPASHVVEKAKSVLGKRNRQASVPIAKSVRPTKASEKSRATRELRKLRVDMVDEDDAGTSPKKNRTTRAAAETDRAARELQKLKVDMADDKNNAKKGRLYKIPTIVNPLTKKKERKRFKGYVYSDEEGDSEDDRARSKSKEPKAVSVEPRLPARLSKGVIKRKSKAKQPSKPARKRLTWKEKKFLTEGLFVGQDRHFDPKLSTAKDQEKSAQKEQVKERKILPLPMFSEMARIEKGKDFELPFSVFSPLPPGHPKPDEWKKTQKNVFIGDAKEIWKKAVPHPEDSRCECYKKEDAVCGEDCFNRVMLYECDEKNCKVGAERCTNRPFAELKKRRETKKKDDANTTDKPFIEPKRRREARAKYEIGVEVVETADGRGSGIRANRSFEPNQIIVEYTGEIITPEECDRRMATDYKNAKCYYLMEFDQGMVLDATRGSIARFVNHSCEPNCQMVKWTVGGVPRMALFAGDKGIHTGEELTYDYRFDPFSAKSMQECLCGAPKCRGVLGPKPKEPKEALKPLTESKRRNFQQMAGDALDSVTKKRKIAVPTSVKTAVTNVKEEAAKRISRAFNVASANSEPIVKKKQSSGLKRKRDEDESNEEPAVRKRRHTPIDLPNPATNAAPSNKKPSRRTTTPSTKAAPSEKKPTRRTTTRSVEQKDTENVAKMPKQRNTVRKKAANAGNTIKGASRGGTPGKTIRVTEDEIGTERDQSEGSLDDE